MRKFLVAPLQEGHLQMWNMVSMCTLAYTILQATFSIIDCGRTCRYHRDVTFDAIKSKLDHQSLSNCKFYLEQTVVNRKL